MRRVHIGPAQPARSYLDAAAIIGAARKTGAAAVHPGYGFLAENADFARQVIARRPDLDRAPTRPRSSRWATRSGARNLMERPACRWRRAAASRSPTSRAAIAEADRIGYPVMVKAAAGGGGIGMGAAADDADLRAGFETARSRAERFFGSPEILIERYVERARHVEVQILGLADGRVLALGERDCSVQRRHQKVAEETPSPGVSPGLREQMLAAAVRAGEAVGYRGAGTVECLVDAETGSFVFLEMNTRLQVEHPVTELVTGIDLVEQQFLIAAGEPVSFDPAAVTPVRARARAARLRRGPGPVPAPSGHDHRLGGAVGDGIRVDAGYQAGNTVTPFYDPLLAKLCVYGADRDQALARAREAVAAFVVAGPKTNLPFHAEPARQRRVRQRGLRYVPGRPGCVPEASDARRNETGVAGGRGPRGDGRERVEGGRGPG